MYQLRYKFWSISELLLMLYRLQSLPEHCSWPLQFDTAVQVALTHHSGEMGKALIRPTRAVSARLLILAYCLKVRRV